jgi:hypothetical protein
MNWNPRALSLPLLACALAAVALSSCRTPLVCGNAAFGYHLSLAKPVLEHPFDATGAVRLLAIAPDGSVTLRLLASGREFRLRRGKSFFDPRVSDSTFELDQSNPATGEILLGEQIVPGGK